MGNWRIYTRSIKISVRRVSHHRRQRGFCKRGVRRVYPHHLRPPGAPTRNGDLASHVQKRSVRLEAAPSRSGPCKPAVVSSESARAGWIRRPGRRTALRMCLFVMVSYLTTGMTSRLPFPSRSGTAGYLVVAHLYPRVALVRCRRRLSSGEKWVSRAVASDSIRDVGQRRRNCTGVERGRGRPKGLRRCRVSGREGDSAGRCEVRVGRFPPPPPPG